VVGRLTADGVLRARSAGRVVAEVAARSLTEEAPRYRRPMDVRSGLEELWAEDPLTALPPVGTSDSLLRLLATPNVASKRWAWERYDSIVQGNTVAGPGGDAAVIRLEGSVRAIAVSTDGNGRYGRLDPYLGGAHAVAEAARNVACVGARPLAVTNCLNFGSPERPEVMWAFREAIRGMGDACRALGTPVTGGNVSFYNESAGSSIPPTPIVGMLGLLDDHRLRLGSELRPGMSIYLLGETFAELGGSEYAEAILGRVSGRPPGLDLQREAELVSLLVEAASRRRLGGAHDPSDGGLAVALAEAAIAGDCGFAVSLPAHLPPHVGLFSESASRTVVWLDPSAASDLEALAGERGVPIERIGESGGPRMAFGDEVDVPVAEAAAVYEEAIPRMLRRLAG
jgi:phosphoribosylformylglycinamidine (FGAM) synthase-like enzyme